MSDRLRKWLVWIGYPLFGLFAFITFLYVTFPLEKLKPQLETRAAAALGMEVTIGDLSARPLAGVSAESVTLVSRPSPRAALAAAGAEAQKPSRLHLDQVVVKLSVLPLLWGGLDVSFWAQGLGGEVEGSFEQRNSSKQAPAPSTGIAGRRPPRLVDWEARAELAQINLALLQVVKEAIGLPITGKVTGRAELAVPEARWSNAGGTLELDLEECSLGDGKAKLKIPGNPLLAMGVTLPRVRIGHLRGQISIEKGVASVRLTSQDRIGEVDLEADVEGKINLRDPLPFSSLDLYAKLRVNPELKKRDAKFELLENGLTTARRPDGSYGIQIVGMLRAPQTRLSPVGGPGVPPGRYAPSRTGFR